MVGGGRRRRQAAGGVELLSGLHPVREALRARRRPLRGLRLETGARPELAELESLATAAGVTTRRVGEAELGAGLAAGTRHQGAVLEAGPLPKVSLAELAEAGPPGRRCLVALDGVEDPQNLGAIVRVAEGAGAGGLLLTERRAPPLGPVVSRASAGASEHLPVARVVNLPRALKELKQKGFWVLGSVLGEAEELYRLPGRWLEGDLVLVFGAEGRGLRRGVEALLDHRLRIPMAGRVDSLNVATAAAVVLFELRRRRLTP